MKLLPGLVLLSAFHTGSSQRTTRHYVNSVSVIAQKTFPVGFTFHDEYDGETKTLSEISALAVGQLDELYGLSDGGEIVHGYLLLGDGATAAEFLEAGVFNNVTMSIEFTSASSLLSAGASNTGEAFVDAEGLVLVDRAELDLDGNDAFQDSLTVDDDTFYGDDDPLFIVSSEEDLRSKAAIGYYLSTNLKSEAVFAGSAVDWESQFPRHRLKRNKGFEALCKTKSSSAVDHPQLITTTESNLQDDAAGVLRIASFDLNTGKKTKTIRYSVADELAGVSEMVALDDLGLEGEGVLLTLERSYTPETGSVVKLYQVDTRFTNDIGGCANLNSGSCGTPYKTLVKDFATLPDIKVDNFEGMVIVAQNDQHALLLLSTDDNNNKNQTGTQFLLLDLELKQAGGGVQHECHASEPSACAVREQVDNDASPWYGMWVLTAAVMGVVCVCLGRQLDCPRGARARGQRRLLATSGGTEEVLDSPDFAEIQLASV